MEEAQSCTRNALAIVLGDIVPCYFTLSGKYMLGVVGYRPDSAVEEYLLLQDGHSPAT